MYQKNEVDLVYRFICTITFLVTIFFLNNYITTIVLLIFFFLCIHHFGNYFFSFLAILSFIFLIICYIIKNYSLLNILVIIDYSCYFLSDSKNEYEEEIDDDDENIKLTEDELIRFKKEGMIAKDYFNIKNTSYLTIHLGLLFLAILVGSCVI